VGKSLQVGQDQLGVYDTDVFGRVVGFVDMCHIGVVKGPHDLDDGISGANMTQELVAQALTLAGAGYQPGNINEGNSSRDDLISGVQLGQFTKTWVGHRNNAGIGLNRRERIVGGQDMTAGQGVEEGGFTDVGQAYNRYAEHLNLVFIGRDNCTGRRIIIVRCDAVVGLDSVGY
jgi:hypothetical protein